jgi:hypothetical protein
MSELTKKLTLKIDSTRLLIFIISEESTANSDSSEDSEATEISHSLVLTFFSFKSYT